MCVPTNAMRRSGAVVLLICAVTSAACGDRALIHITPRPAPERPAQAVPEPERDTPQHPSLFVPRATGPITVDGHLDEPAWDVAPKVYLARRAGLEPMRPIVGRALWDDEHLYIGFRVYDTDVRANLTERDAWLWEDGDVVEAFFYFGQPETRFLEIELNPQNAFLDLRFPTGDPNWPEPASWQWQGAQWAVHVDGTLNDNTTPDRGWTAEVALPWAGLPEDVADLRPSRILFAAYNRDLLHDGRTATELTYWPLLTREGFHRTHEYAFVEFVPAAGDPDAGPDQPREGFTRIVHGQASASRFYRGSYRGHVPVWYMTGEGEGNGDDDASPRLAWRTAPAPDTLAADETVTFGFVGGASGPRGALALYVDGERTLEFLDDESRGPWSADGATLRRHRRAGGAYYTLTLASDRVTPGEPVTLEVRPAAPASAARFTVHAWTDAALMEQHHDGRWSRQRQ